MFLFLGLTNQSRRVALVVPSPQKQSDVQAMNTVEDQNAVDILQQHISFDSIDVIEPDLQASSVTTTPGYNYINTSNLLRQTPNLGLRDPLATSCTKDTNQSEDERAENNTDSEYIPSSSSSSSEAEFEISEDQNKRQSVQKTYRKRDKRHACCYCNKVMLNLARHFEGAHDKEIEVARLLAMPKNSSDRRNGFIELSRKGDYYYNLNIIKTGKGDLILPRRPGKNDSKIYTYDDFVPCPNCLGFMRKKLLWHHVKYGCVSKQENTIGYRKVGWRKQVSRLLQTADKNLAEDFAEKKLAEIQALGE